jgi:hypothetical protein
MTKSAEMRPIGLWLVILVVFAEGLFVAYLAAVLGLGILEGQSRSLNTMIALFAMVAGAAALVIFIAISLWRGKRWARSASFFWQLIQLAVATGSFGGQFGSQAIGWGLIIPSAIVIVTLFNKDVVAATMKSVDPE